ncbi:HPP family protein [Paraburkholderia sp. PREW-6R]|uniref:HPP family protein n=1 Tax=Paraburkholderia sp. PREW-6R TaxID=3141544 RepID=UPI0031F4CABC
MPCSAALRWLTRLLPAPAPAALPWRERMRSCFGALLGIAFTGAVTHVLSGPGANIPMLVAPMGASAVLLFAVPASPLAQPWSIIGGNVVSATLGVACASWIHDPLQAAAVAVAAAICAMFALRCVHPPSGAVALTAVLGGPTVHALGYRFVLAPIALQSVALLGSAIVYHALTGHRYPHTARTAGSINSTNGANASHFAPDARAAFTRADLDAVLSSRTEWLDVAPDDLEALLRALQLQTYARSFDELTCADIMSRNMISVGATMPASTAAQMLQRHGVKALPVTDLTQQVIGIVTRADLGGSERRGGFVRLWHSMTRGRSRSEPTVATLMTAQVRTVRTDTPLAELVPLFAEHGHHHIPVLNHETGQLAGTVTQADVIAGLYRRPNHRAEQAQSPVADRRAA